MKEKEPPTSDKIDRIAAGLAGGAGLGASAGAIAEGIRTAYFAEAEALPYIAFAIGALLGFRWLNNMALQDQKKRNS
ncbi:hypothetical protein HY502_01430 [Candidatus Woesebacteria bacterium]|nr:hypothetical protein [Candidatus Woesebacteria bacterium]